MWYIKTIESSFLKSFSKLTFESRILDDDPANSYPSVVILTIIGTVAIWWLWIWWLERKDRGREN
jgi:hypothetical protein